MSRIFFVKKKTFPRITYAIIYVDSMCVFNVRPKNRRVLTLVRGTTRRRTAAIAVGTHCGTVAHYRCAVGNWLSGEKPPAARLHRNHRGTPESVHQWPTDKPRCRLRFVRCSSRRIAPDHYKIILL